MPRSSSSLTEESDFEEDELLEDDALVDKIGTVLLSIH